jgi:hypothetical protein
LGKAEFTVRAAHLGQVRWRKKNHGRGKYRAEVIAHDERLRIQSEGRLPRK